VSRLSSPGLEAFQVPTFQELPDQHELEGSEPEITPRQRIDRPDYLIASPQVPTHHPQPHRPGASYGRSLFTPHSDTPPAVMMTPDCFLHEEDPRSSSEGGRHTATYLRAGGRPESAPVEEMWRQQHLRNQSASPPLDAGRRPHMGSPGTIPSMLRPMDTPSPNPTMDAYIERQSVLQHCLQFFKANQSARFYQEVLHQHLLTGSPAPVSPFSQGLIPPMDYSTDPDVIRRAAFEQDFPFSGQDASPAKQQTPPPQQNQAQQQNQPQQQQQQRKKKKAKEEVKRPDVDASRQDLRELRGSVCHLAQQQSGSRYLQRHLTRGSAQTVATILAEVEQEVGTLMCDQYGNYFCQELFQVCSPDQRTRLLDRLALQIIEIAQDKRGTHALQALIQLLSTDNEQAILIRAIQPHIVDLSMHQHGTHVVQRVVSSLSVPVKGVIFQAVLGRFKEVAKDPFGLCVVKKCITEATTLPLVRELIQTQLAANAVELAQDMYGNYAVQQALEAWGGGPMANVIKQVLDRFVTLAVQKCSSNVVEKCLLYASEEARCVALAELGRSPDSMRSLLKSSFGNFVLLRAYEVAHGQQQGALKGFVQKNLTLVPNKRTRQKWERALDGHPVNGGIDG